MNNIGIRVRLKGAADVISYSRRSPRTKKDGAKETPPFRFPQSYIRALFMIKDISECNKFECFITLTASALHIRCSRKIIVQQLTKLTKDCKRIWPAFTFLAVPEKDRDGNWHIHMLASGIPADNLVLFSDEHVGTGDQMRKNALGAKHYDWLRAHKYFGIVDVQRIGEMDEYGQVITQPEKTSYMVKQLEKMAKKATAALKNPELAESLAETCEKGTKLYTASKGLKRSPEIHLMVNGDAEFSSLMSGLNIEVVSKGIFGGVFLIRDITSRVIFEKRLYALCMRKRGEEGTSAEAKGYTSQ